jgi:hypothetical protein
MSISQNYPITSPSLSLDFANTKALDPRITFSRPTDAVYYDGKSVSLAEQNLVTYSQEFDNASWLKYQASVTANSVTAPDGTTTADTLTSTVTGTVNYAYKPTIGNSNLATYSFYAKKGTTDFIGIYIGASPPSLSWANFNISSGSVASFNNCVASISSAGDGWYRCVVSKPDGVDNYFHLLPKDSDPAANPYSNGTWTSGGYLYLWGAQLEARDTVTAYTPTTTQAITNYIPTLLTAPANTARFDHNPVTGESLGLLVEEQRTNLVTYSEDFADASWSKLDTTITENAIVAPDGTLTGNKMVANTNGGVFHYGKRTVALSAGTYTYSIYAKAGEYTTCFINFPLDSTLNTFNLSTGTVIYQSPGVTASITLVGNGWYRLICTYTLAVSGNVTPFFGLQTGAFTGNGYSGIFIWGASLEQGSFSTSYVKTQASQVTRSADSASMTGANFSDWYRADEGTVYVECTLPSTAASYPLTVALSDGTGSNYISLNKGTANSTQAQNLVLANGASQATLTTSNAFTANISCKNSVAYKVNDFASSVNNLVPVTDTLGVVPIVNQLSIGFSTSFSALNGTIKKIAYYPTRLSNENLQALTS